MTLGIIIGFVGGVAYFGILLVVYHRWWKQPIGEVWILNRDYKPPKAQKVKETFNGKKESYEVTLN